MTTRASELVARIMPYCQWLHDGTEWHLKPEAEATIEAALVAAENAVLERAAEKCVEISRLPTKWLCDYGTEPWPPTAFQCEEAIRALMDRPSGETEVPNPTRALARLFETLWNAGYDGHRHPFDVMVNFGLLKIADVSLPDTGYEITSPGRVALTLAKGPENG